MSIIVQTQQHLNPSRKKVPYPICRRGYFRFLLEHSRRTNSSNQKQCQFQLQSRNKLSKMLDKEQSKVEQQFMKQCLGHTKEQRKGLIKTLSQKKEELLTLKRSYSSLSKLLFTGNMPQKHPSLSRLSLNSTFHQLLQLQSKLNKIDINKCLTPREKVSIFKK